MNRSRLSITLLIITAMLSLFATSCFGNTSMGSSTTSPGEALKPKPIVGKVTAATSGNEFAYYATLNIPILNEGAKGTVLIVATVTQGGLTQKEEFPLFLKQGETRETELTFPLKWKGGEFTINVKCEMP